MSRPEGGSVPAPNLVYPPIVTQDTGESEFVAALEATLLTGGLAEIPVSQAGRLARHFALLRSWNARVNLTRIVDPAEAARLHYAESLFAAQFIAGALTVLDVGSGAGFPAVPFAVVRPDVHVTALEANQKKCVFLKEVKDILRLDNFEVVRARLEEHDWSGYELITARALDRAEQVAPGVTRALRPQQRFLLFCTEDLARVIRESAGDDILIETHHIPGSRERLVAVCSRTPGKR